MITVYILTREFGSSPICDLNNPEWLCKQDRISGRVYASPLDAYVANYFYKSFIKPLLDFDGYIKEEFWENPLTTSFGISYCIKKWHKNQHNDSFTKTKELC